MQISPLFFYKLIKYLRALFRDSLLNLTPLFSAVFKAPAISLSLPLRVIAPKNSCIPLLAKLTSPDEVKLQKNKPPRLLPSFNSNEIR